MTDTLAWLSQHPTVALVLLVTLVALFMLVLLLAFVQKREISFWPPRIGPAVGSYGSSKAVSVIYGYHATLAYLVQLVREAEQEIWTVRTHLGESSAEEPLFNELVTRVLNPHKPLEDVRRNIRLLNSIATQRHLENLVHRLADRTAVKVKYFRGNGPAFDFIIVDGRRAVIGLPMAEAQGVGASLIIEDPAAVECLKYAFSDLWEQSTPLFYGNPLVTAEERTRLLSIVAAEIADSAEATRRSNPGYVSDRSGSET